jgi:hypothetical protein
LALNGKKPKKRKDDLEKYRKLLDETLKDLRKMYELKYNKINPALAIAGVLIVAIGGVIITYSTSMDVFIHERITFWGSMGIFFGISTAFVGYIIAHRGFKGCWL